MYLVFIVLFLIFDLIFNQVYKLCTHNSTGDGALTVLLELIAGVSILVALPFFDFNFSTDPLVYFFLALAIIFYAITDRINTTVRRNIEVSVFNIIKQLYTVFMIVGGIMLFQEPIVFTKLLGAFLIVFSNALIFYKKGNFKINKNIVLAVLANITFAIAMLIDVNNSSYFSLPIYISITLILPGLLIFVFERVKVRDLKEELNFNSKKYIFITGIAFGLSALFQLRAYQLGEIIVVAPLTAIAVILNVFAGYFFLNEKSHLYRKIFSACLIIVSVILISI